MPDLLHLVFSAPDSSLLYAGHYDPLLVVLSVGIAIFASHASFMVSQHVAAGGAAMTRYGWTLVGGFCMGAGVWAMHFTGMLAFSLPCATTYDPVVTLLSMIPGVLASTLAVWIVSRREISFARLASGGLLLGAGIGTMHYTGMAAYRMNGLIRYDLKLFLLSLLAAVVLATLALWIKFQLQSWQARWRAFAPAVGAVVMGLAVSAMHYTAMTAAYFIRDGDASLPESQLAPAFIASVVLVITSAIILITLIAIFLARPSVFSFARIYRPVGVLILGWGAVAWMGAGYYGAHLADRTYRDELAQAHRSMDSVGGNIRGALATLRGVPEVLAHEETLRKELARFGPTRSPLEISERRRLWTDDAALSRLNAYLAIMAGGFNAEAVWVVNAAGDCIAASNASTPGSFVGTNYDDRQYFRQARAGGQSHQYAIGRVSKAPGLFYSYPVFLQGQFAGAVVAKRDIAGFLPWIKPANGFIADANGVIVLALDRNLEYQTLPGATVMALPEQERTQRYQRGDFKPLSIGAWKDHGFDGVVRFGRDPLPLALLSQPIAEGDIRIYVARPLPALVRIEDERPWIFLLVFIAGGMLIVAVAALTLNVRATRQAKEAAEDALVHLKEHELQLQHIANYDALTGLPNRRLLADRLNQAMAQAMREGHLMAVCYLDLDGFKPVNDELGHEYGDHLLIEVARRLENCVRAGDTVARLGGDEFVLVLTDFTGIETCHQILQRVLNAVSAPFTLEDCGVALSASIGASLYPDDRVDPDTLLRHADQAMYIAKENGRNRYHLFDPELDRQARAHRESLGRLAEALENREFVLHYQPQVNMKSGELLGAEALIRWNHPEKGLLAPAAFLDVLSGSPLEIAVGEWVIETALSQAEAWRTAGLRLPVSVNVSSEQLMNAGFSDWLAQSLARHPGIGSADLELEVLESSAIEDIGRTEEIIDACRLLGVRFALDDFGTGYSSLTHFRRLGIDTLKIDQSFIRDMLHDPEDLAIVESVVGLAQTFKRHAIAEGVETADHAAMLVHLGCSDGQGYGIARPMPAAALPGWLKEWRETGFWRGLALPDVPSDGVGLLVARQAHLDWAETLVSHIRNGSPDRPPVLESHRCGFGRWLYGLGRHRSGPLPEFREIEAKHDQFHDLAQEIVAIKDTGRAADARTRLDDLAVLANALQTSIDGLQARIKVGA
ncbi:MAG: EAL domain-containing protein [Sulfuricella sp.]|nr:EAL domain-containing protein [Sulfuricella sp.]